MRILVTGGTGFIGSNIALQLLADGHEVLITGTDAEQRLPNFKGKYLQPNFVGLDWQAIGPINAVFHEAAINDTTLYDQTEMFLANLESPKKLFEYAATHGCHHIIYASSAAVYGNLPAPHKESLASQPLNPYAESKMELDKFAMGFAKTHPEITVIGLRYSNVYGPRENHKGRRASIIYQLAQQMMNINPDIIFKNGEGRRDYVYVKDVVKANLLALQAKESGIYNCGSGQAVSFNELVAVLNSVLGTKRVPEYADNPYAANFQLHTECDQSLAKEKLGHVPDYDVQRGIADYAKTGFLMLADRRFLDIKHFFGR